jgi:tRNA nucleotidyltransferase (CCA-adding enzyme)
MLPASRGGTPQPVTPHAEPQHAPDLVARLRVPPAVHGIAERLERAGYETWCVGGAVRDAILGEPTLDWDLATSAPPDVVRRLFRRTVPKGIEFGTVGVFDAQGAMHEVTTFRRDVRTDGRHAVVEFGASLDDDLARRDLTINAIAFRPTAGTLHDPFDGIGDLSRRLVRAVGDPAARMREDRLRALRAIRFAGRFDFALDPATWEAIVASGPHLGRLSPERVREELEKTMRQLERPSLALERWRAAGALGTLVPGLADAPTVAFVTADCLPRPDAGPHARQRLWNRMAAPWLGLSRAVVESGLRALRCSNQEVRWIADLSERWETLGPALRHALLAPTEPDDATLRRWAAIIGRTLVPGFMRLAAARFAAERGAGQAGPDARRIRAVHRRLVRIAYRDPLAVGDLAVSGRELMAVGVAPGPALGVILQRLLDVVLADPACNDRERLLAVAGALASEGSGARVPRQPASTDREPGAG